MIKGSIVALVTPFDEDNKINYNELKRLLDFHIENQTDGILLLGTTAEAENLNDDERYSLVKFVIDYLNDQIPVMVGIISNNTRRAVLLAETLKDLNIDSYLVSAPYYIKSNTEGLIHHFTYIADHVNRPIILYNVPKRNGFNLDLELVKILSYHKNIIGIKEASGDLAYQTQLSMFCDKNTFVLYAADDLTLLPSLSLGAIGVISVINNAFPKEMKLLVDSYDKD
nr:4-hydroxy-tetrahydrodipicolinate synthase [Anaeroplasmataceae bacterium]